MQAWAELAGRLHPLLVHLPIGVLLLAAGLYGLARSNRHAPLRASLSPILLFGAVSAWLACGTGWLLKPGGGYPQNLVQRHQYAGLAVAAAATLAWSLQGRWRVGRAVLLGLTAPLLLSLIHI